MYRLSAVGHFTYKQSPHVCSEGESEVLLPLQTLQDLVSHHVDSFNYLLDDGLQRAVEDISPQELVDPCGRRMVLLMEAASIGLPTTDVKNVHAKSVQVFPSEVGGAGGRCWWVGHW